MCEDYRKTPIQRSSNARRLREKEKEKEKEKVTESDRLIVVLAPGEEEAEEVKVPMVPFPVALPEDPGLIWVLARREDLPPPDAARALGSIEEEFWETKTGLKLQQKGTEKSFAEFIARVPAAALAESGIKRHYKEPEALKTLTRLAPRAADRIETESQLGLAS